MVTQDDILEVLKNVRDPDRGADIVSLNMIRGVQVSEDGQVVFLIEVDPQRGGALEGLRQEAESCVSELAGVRKVSAILTAEKKGTGGSDEASFSASSSQSTAGRAGAAADPHGMAKNPVLDLKVKKIIAVSSGKGGVGKSTISMALAHNLAKNSHLRVGLLDADIYGPSQVILAGMSGIKPDFNAQKKIIPPRLDLEGNAHGLKVMSIGFMVDTEKALVWRGPMVQSAIYQLFRDVQWADDDGSELDVLIVDMPPGTGDAQLTLAQKVATDGAIIISTPQDLALADVRRGVEMFGKTGVPVLGVIENMSTHVCSACGHEEHIFGHGGARLEAEKMGVPFLGEVPLSLSIREAADKGENFDLPEEILENVKSALGLES